MAKKKAQPEQWKYTGFARPESNFFKMPNDWTNITAKITSLAELKVIEYVLRHTWGFQEYGIAKKITTDEFMNGRKGKDGDRFDKGTGLSNRSIIDGLRRAVAHGLLIEKVDDRDKARVKKYYMLNMQPSNDENNPGVKNLHTGVKKVHSKGEDSSQRSEKETIETNFIVVKRLMALKIFKDTANELAYRFSKDYIERKIELLEWKQSGGSVGRPIKDPAAWLIRAIEQDYKHPKDFMTTAEREAKEKEDEKNRAKLSKRDRAAREREKALRSNLAEEYQSLDEYLSVWEIALWQLQEKFSRQFYETWLKDTSLLTVEDGKVTIGVANKVAQEKLTVRAKDEIAEVLSDLFDDEIRVRFEVLES